MRGQGEAELPNGSTRARGCAASGTDGEDPPIGRVKAVGTVRRVAEPVQVTRHQLTATVDVTQDRAIRIDGENFVTESQ